MMKIDIDGLADGIIMLLLPLFVAGVLVFILCVVMAILGEG